MSHEKFLSYSFPTNTKEFIELCQKFISKTGLAIVETDPYMSIFSNIDNDTLFENYKNFLLELKDKCPDLLFCTNYHEIIIIDSSITEKELFPLPKHSIVSIYINSYYKNGKKHLIEHETIVDKIKVWQNLGLIVIPIVCTIEDINFLEKIIEDGLISENSFVLFEFSGSGNLQPSPENYKLVKSNIKSPVNIILACEGQNWENLARTAIVNGDHIRIGLKDSLAVQSNELFYDKIISISSAFGRSIAKSNEMKKILKIYP